MRYIYFDEVILVVTVLDHESTEYGELIGTSKTWATATPATKKFLLSVLINNAKHHSITDLTVHDCDVPKPMES